MRRIRFAWCWYALWPLIAPFARAQEVPPYIARAIEAPDRPEQDRARDADRKPGDVLFFFGIEPGDKVADLMTGQGYYADILARVVGHEGQVYAQNNAFVLKRFAEKGLSKRLENPNLANVIRWDRELDDLGLPQALDAVIMVLFYHDTYWQQVNRPKMNRDIFEALKPGGIFGIVDHHAEEGSGDRDVNTIHRVDLAWVKKEILAAGFTLEASSDLLANTKDPRTENVFRPGIRGKTDRFVLKFRKPDH